MGKPTELRVLGGVVFCRDDKSLAFGGPKAQLVLSVLIANRRGSVSTDRLIEAVWSDRPPRSAGATIQSQISRLRSVLAPNFTITFEPAGYRLDAHSGEFDIDVFESLLSKSRAVGVRESIAVLDHAIGLWSGPAFGQFADVPEIRSEAIRLDELRLVATDEWAEAKMAVGDPGPMVGELEALVSLHPLRECYWRLLMLALYRSGRQAEALRRVTEFRSILNTEIGLDISPALRELESQILADDPSLLVEREAVDDSRATTVTAPQLFGATSFVGRDPDLVSLTEALKAQPLVTITGPGGVGKTRLAMRLAGNIIDDFADGVTIVEFAALRDPAGAGQVIAAALDVQQRRHRTIEVTIQEFLAPTETLLLLDNCEHVIDVLAPLVDRLRSSCPGLRILATSRRSLGLAGEYIEVLDPLSVPDVGADMADEVRRSAAVELFVGRAEVATPGFELTDANASAVAGICRQLDGLPLALELAAARLRTMGVAALDTNLQQRIDLLGQTQLGADGRQRTLHDLVRWSYELLEPGEREVFEQLSVFAGGFDLTAAEAVCDIEGGLMSTVAHVASLVDKSMVVLVDPVLSRYRLLEPLRDFGLHHLRESGALDATEDRHFQWFLDLAERGAVGLDSPDEPVWSADLDRDYDNLRAAHLTAVQRGDAAGGLRLVASLREFSFRRVRYEITAWADVASNIEGADGNPDLPTVLGMSAYGRFVRGDMQTSIELAQLALDTSENPELSDSGLPERVLGNACFYLEQIAEATAWMDRMVLSARRSGSSGRIAHALYMWSVAQTSVDDYVRGAVLAGEARAVADAAGSPTAYAEADYALGLALEGTDPAEALRYLERASALGADAGNRWVEAFAQTEVLSLKADQGEHLLALAGYADVVDTWYRGGDWANQWLSLRHVLGLLIELEAHEAAVVLHGAITAVGASRALPFVPSDAERLARRIDDARSVLGAVKFAAAMRQGGSMQGRQIVSFVKQQIVMLTTDTIVRSDP